MSYTTHFQEQSVSNGTIQDSWTIFACLLQAHGVAEAKTVQYDPEAPRAGQKVTQGRWRVRWRAFYPTRMARGAATRGVPTFHSSRGLG